MNESEKIQEKQLVDQYGRKIDYIRISVTDRCDFRCRYCMSENMQFAPHDSLLSLEELYQIANAYVDLGIKRIRITGGEPLVRRDLLSLMKKLGKLSELEDLTLTTNGSQLSRFAAELKNAGVTRINISLDTLDAKRFLDISRVGKLQNTLDGIHSAIDQEFNRLKINSVILKNQNHHEIVDLLNFAIERNIDISFIETMPMGITGNQRHRDAYYSTDQILKDISDHYDLIPTAIRTAGPARYYRISGYPHTRVGFISPHSHNFCSTCNRVRLTAKGLLLLCLGQEHSVDLKKVIRRYPDNDTKLKQVLIESLSIKPQGHDFDIYSNEVLLRHMNVTGG